MQQAIQWDLLLAGGRDMMSQQESTQACRLTALPQMVISLGTQKAASM